MTAIAFLAGCCLGFSGAIGLGWLLMRRVERENEAEANHECDATISAAAAAECNRILLSFGERFCQQHERVRCQTCAKVGR